MVSRGKRNTLSREEARAALERRDTEGRTNALHNEMLKKEKALDILRRLEVEKLEKFESFCKRQEDRRTALEVRIMERQAKRRAEAQAFKETRKLEAIANRNKAIEAFNRKHEMINDPCIRERFEKAKARFAEKKAKAATNKSKVEMEDNRDWREKLHAEEKEQEQNSDSSGDGSAAAEVAGMDGKSIKLKEEASLFGNLMSNFGLEAGKQALIDKAAILAERHEKEFSGSRLKARLSKVKSSGYGPPKKNTKEKKESKVLPQKDKVTADRNQSRHSSNRISEKETKTMTTTKMPLYSPPDLVDVNYPRRRLLARRKQEMEKNVAHQGNLLGIAGASSQKASPHERGRLPGRLRAEDVERLTIERLHQKAKVEQKLEKDAEEMRSSAGARAAAVEEARDAWLRKQEAARIQAMEAAETHNPKELLQSRDRREKYDTAQARFLKRVAVERRRRLSTVVAQEAPRELDGWPLKGLISPNQAKPRSMNGERMRAAERVETYTPNTTASATGPTSLNTFDGIREEKFREQPKQHIERKNEDALLAADHVTTETAETTTSSRERRSRQDKDRKTRRQSFATGVIIWLKRPHLWSKRKSLQMRRQKQDERVEVSACIGAAVKQFLPSSSPPRDENGLTFAEFMMAKQKASDASSNSDGRSRDTGIEYSPASLIPPSFMSVGDKEYIADSAASIVMGGH